MLPLTVMSGFDCLLKPTKEKALSAYVKNQGKMDDGEFQMAAYPILAREIFCAIRIEAGKSS